MSKQELISKLREYDSILRDMIGNIEQIVKEAKKRVISSMGERLARDLINDINRERRENNKNIMRLDYFDDAEMAEVTTYLLGRIDDYLSRFRARIANLPKRMI